MFLLECMSPVWVPVTLLSIRASYQSTDVYVTSLSAGVCVTSLSTEVLPV